MKLDIRIKQFVLMLTLAALLPLKSYAFLGIGKTSAKTIEQNKKVSRIVQAASSGDSRTLARLIQSGANINAKDAGGQTALIKASSSGNDQMVYMLIKSGADIQAKDINGNTALHYAAANNHKNTTHMLVRNGAIINRQNLNGHTPLDLAIKNKRIDIVNALDPQSIHTIRRKVGTPQSSTLARASSSGGSLSTTAIVTTGLGVAAAGAGIAIAAGAGGSSDSSSTSSTAIPTVNSTEYSNQQGLALINANQAYARGYNGQGVKVAVIDSGVDLDHPELASNIASGTGATFQLGVNTGGGGNEEGEDHGTHVAGIIANASNASGTLGVAYKAQIVPINSYFIIGFASQDLVLGINHAVSQGARVINMSLGGATADASERAAIVSALSGTGSNSILIAAATGNDGDSEASYPARHAGEAAVNVGVPDYDDANDDGGALLAVGAVDNSGDIASFSNHCGDAKNWCLVAPGVDIKSSVIGGGISAFSGTSMAAPHVAGAAAVLMDMDPQLTAREVAEILLLTADPLGADEISDIYGHGLLNLDKATQPIGTSSIPLGSVVGGPSVTLNSTKLSTSFAFGDAVSGSALSFAILDSYKRDYLVSLSDLSYAQNSFDKFEERFDNFANDITQKRDPISEQMSFAVDQIVNRNPAEDEDETKVRVSFATGNDKQSLEVNYNVPMNQAFRMGALKDVSTSMDNVGTNSVLGLVKGGISNNSKYKVNDNLYFSFGSFKSEEDYGDVSGVVSQYDLNKGAYEAALQFGMMNESSSLLGSKTEGAFSVNENTPTWFYNIASAYNVSDNTKLFGTLNYGITFPESSSYSLINDISRIQTYSFSAGLRRSSIIDHKDKLELIVSQPLRVMDGSANVVLPLGRDISGNIYSSSYDLSLSPSGRQLDFGAFYSMNLNLRTRFSAGAIYITQPGHVRSAKDEMMFMAKYALGF